MSIIGPTLIEEAPDRLVVSPPRDDSPIGKS